MNEKIVSLGAIFGFLGFFGTLGQLSNYFNYLSNMDKPLEGFPWVLTPPLLLVSGGLILVKTYYDDKKLAGSRGKEGTC